VVRLPCRLAGKRLVLKLHVVPGEVPLLLSKGMLKSLGAKIDMVDDRLLLTRVGLEVPLREASRGSHYQIDLMDARIPTGHVVRTSEVEVTFAGEDVEVTETLWTTEDPSVAEAAAGFR